MRELVQRLLAYHESNGNCVPSNTRLCDRFSALFKIFRLLESLRYDIQQLTKQNDRLSAVVQQLVDGRFGTGTECSILADDVDFELPVESRAGLTELENQLKDNEQMNSLVSNLVNLFPLSKPHKICASVNFLCVAPVNPTVISQRTGLNLLL